jgi:MerR family transcriptional regulator, light-induced transcriptional regulator
VTDDRSLSLRDAAAELGVHYQTAYKWVVSGALPAVMVQGRYVISTDVLAEYARHRDEPVAPRVRTAARRPERVDRAADRMHVALMAGDEPAVRAITATLLEKNVPLVTVLQDVVSPALRRIGTSWSAGSAPIWAEHRASAIVERLLGQLQRETRGRRRGTIVVASMAGDLHNLPSAMATAVLRDDNWTVQHLGSNVPAEELRAFCAEHDVDLVVLTVTTADVVPAAERLAADLRAAGVTSLVGGPGRTLDELRIEARAAVRGRASAVGGAEG